MVNETDQTASLAAISGWTKSDWAYHELRRRILDGTLRPGSLLEKETVAAQLGTSTTPVREALRRLEAENLVISNAYKKVQVAALSETELLEIYSVRLVLDPFAARLAVEQATDDEVAAVLRLVSGPLGKPSSIDERIAANREFHRAIHYATHNRVLIEVLDSLWDRTDRYRAAQFRDSIALQDEKRDREHREIGHAFEARDGKLAEELTRSHVEDAANLISEITTASGTSLFAERNEIGG